MGIGLAAAGLVEYDPRLLIGVVIGLYALHRSVLLPQLRHASQTDGKTGLYTPNWWHQIAEGAFTRAEAERTSLGVLMLDLDHFKRLNDTHGHLAGDQMLRAVADAITDAVRSYDAACRWGGEEFAILLPDVGPDELLEIAERLRHRVRSLVVDIPSDGQVSDQTVSIGGARYPSPGIATLSDLQLAADAALYAAKAAGRDRVRLAPSSSES
jgi:diguanylate cyclase (GGDEF)-like protein